MIELKSVEKRFKKKKKEIIALDNVSLKFDKGKIYAIMGSSGSGKSTLLNLISMMDRPTSGAIYINDVDVNSYGEKKKSELRHDSIGYIFQDCYMCENLSVYENIMLPLLINKKKTKSEKKEIVNNLIDMIKLSDRSNHLPKELSGGERQRVAIARALVNNPSIILADEPTGNLDKNNEVIIFKIFKQLANNGKCVIIVSHSDEIKKYANKIINLENGKIVGDDNEI
jgi:ABC-type lipoprotein export system ATPase subunit